MSRGVAPTLLLEQVRNSASWALEENDAEWSRTLRDAAVLQRRMEDGSEPPPVLCAAHLVLMLAAHHATVATFVPTDVDARIRHHAWQEISDVATLEAAVDVVDRAAREWNPRPVSARVVVTSNGPLSGHDGEWLAVRAGALGRALQLAQAGAEVDALVERLEHAIDAELGREASAMQESLERNDAKHGLCVATTLAHNVGDLSRVVEDWPARTDRASRMRVRWARLGHDDASRHGGLFVLAGRVNKAVMATENHRFLPLRKPRALRRSRAFLLPIGPFFDRWGATIATHTALDASDRAEILAALLDGHTSSPEQLGYLRAMVGLHGAAAGGLEGVASTLPARLRKKIATGAVREALGVDVARFEARMANRWRAAVG